MVDRGADVTNGISFAESSVRLPYGNLLVGYSERRHGDMRSSESERAFFISRGFAFDRVVMMRQTHSTNVQRVIPGLTTLEADGMYYIGDELSEWTPILTALTADCVAMFLYSEQYPAFGIVHAGWRGILNGIAKKAVSRVISQGIKAETVRILIGPHIRACCYDVDSYRARAFTERFGPTVIEQRNGKSYLSLQSALIRSLGPHRHLVQIFSLCNDCTSCTKGRYFSFRKNRGRSFGEIVHFITAIP